MSTCQLELSRRPVRYGLTDSRTRISKDDEPPLSPTTSLAGTHGAMYSSGGPSKASGKDRRVSELSNYRRDLGSFESTRSHPPSSQPKPQQQQHHHYQQPQLQQYLPHHSHSVGSLGAASFQIAPWASSNAPPKPPPKDLPTSFYNGSSDSLSMASQFSPGFPPAPSRPGTGSGYASQEYADSLYYDMDGRRPSAASVNTTASSQGSKASANRGGFRKLQGFFGEEFPGRDSSESSLPNSVAGKDQRSRSYSHGRPTQRDRNYSNATDREQSPSSSRPRTPVPNPEVVPFLYQDNTVSGVSAFSFSASLFFAVPGPPYPLRSCYQLPLPNQEQNPQPPVQPSLNVPMVWIHLLLGISPKPTPFMWA